MVKMDLLFSKKKKSGYGIYSYMQMEERRAARQAKQVSRTKKKRQVARSQEEKTRQRNKRAPTNNVIKRRVKKKRLRYLREETGVGCQ